MKFLNRVYLRAASDIKNDNVLYSAILLLLYIYIYFVNTGNSWPSFGIVHG
jgi:uncharacterized membrane protein